MPRPNAAVPYSDLLERRGLSLSRMNTASANLSTAIKATYRASSAKHLPDYLGAFCWTTNHRRDMCGMIDAACRAIATSTAITRNAAYAMPGGSTGRYAGLPKAA